MEASSQTRNLRTGGSRARGARVPPTDVYLQEMFDSISDVEREHVFPTEKGNRKGQRPLTHHCLETESSGASAGHAVA